MKTHSNYSRGVFIQVLHDDVNSCVLLCFHSTRGIDWRRREVCRARDIRRR